MKNLNYFIKSLLCLILLFNLCCQSEEECYSCNDSVDNWAHENLLAIQNMKRIDIVKLPASKQRAAFRALSPNLRKGIMISKIDHVLNFVKTKKEKNFVNQIRTIATNTDFSKEWSDEEMASIEEMLLKGSEELNWKNEFIVYAFGTLQNLDSDKNKGTDFFNQSRELEFTQEGDKDCNCNWGWCPDSSDCEESGCSETTTGCSFLLLGPCDEICNPLDLGE